MILSQCFPHSTPGTTIARLYSQHETRVAYKMLWKALFDALDRVTNKTIGLHFLDGYGLEGIILDGCRAQAEGLGDYLVSRNRPEMTGVTDTNPLVMVTHILRLCYVHIDR